MLGSKFLLSSTVADYCCILFFCHAFSLSRVVLYSSMMKLAASGGVNALAAHQVLFPDWLTGAVGGCMSTCSLVADRVNTGVVFLSIGNPMRALHAKMTPKNF